MDSQILLKINEQVYAQFPYLKEITPKIREISAGVNELRYLGSALTDNGMRLPIAVIVTADDQGNIQKLITSR